MRVTLNENSCDVTCIIAGHGGNQSGAPVEVRTDDNRHDSGLLFIRYLVRKIPLASTL
jgi:hypothetical protein